MSKTSRRRAQDESSSESAAVIADAERLETERRQEHLARRIKLLHHETDLMRAEGEDRARTVDSKSSFLAVAAGVIIAASVSGNWHQPWALAVLPMIFAALALACAAIALRPGKRRDVTPKILYDLWFDSERSAGTAELEILRSKIRAFTLREETIRSRALATSVGFGFLLIGVVSLTVVFAFESA